MPVVRARREISSAPLPGVRKSAHTTATSEGAGLEQARAGTAGAVAGIGETVKDIGVTLYRRQQQQARQEADEVALLASQNQVDAWVLREIHDPEKGALTVRGQAALGVSDRVEAGYRKLVGEIEMGIGTPEARQAFRKWSAQRGFNLAVDLSRHEVGQMSAFDEAETDAKIVNARSLAILHAEDPKGQAALAIHEGIEAIRKRGTRTGRGAERVAAEVEAFESATAVGMIENLLSSNRTMEARVLFETMRDAALFTGDALPKMTAAVQRGTTDAAGEQSAARIWTALGPKGDTDPISLDVLETAARAEHGDNTDVLKATIAALRSRKSGVDDGRRERLDARNQSIWGAVLEGQPYEAIRRLPASAGAPDVLLKVRDYLDSSAAREESRAASRESRAAARESRAYTAQQRKENQLELDGWAAYYDASQPENLRALSHGDIMSRLPVLGREHVGRLLKDKEQRTKDDAGLRKLEIENDLFSELAASAGLTYVYKISTNAETAKQQKGTLGRLRATVNDAVAQRAVAATRPLTPAEQRETMQSVIDRQVMIERTWSTDTATPTAIVNPDDRARAYVPLESIPQQSMAEWVNVIRSQFPREQGADKADILYRYRDRIQRAHAAAVLGLGPDEETRRLRGQ